MDSPLELQLSGLGWSVVGLLALMVLLCTQNTHTQLFVEETQQPSSIEFHFGWGNNSTPTCSENNPVSSLFPRDGAFFSNHNT